VAQVADQAAALKWLLAILAVKLLDVQAEVAAQAAAPRWLLVTHAVKLLDVVLAVALRWPVAIHVLQQAVHADLAVALKHHRADAVRSLCSDC
jgi:hypothetical protein